MKITAGKIANDQHVDAFNEDSSCDFESLDSDSKSGMPVSFHNSSGELTIRNSSAALKYGVVLAREFMAMGVIRRD